MLAIKQYMLSDNFNKEDNEKFMKFASIIKNNYMDVDSHREIWEYDKKIGGYGGYAAPLNPTTNPFNRLGEYRNVFRSLQYARCDMFYCNRPRSIILDASLHIECLVKLILSKRRILYIFNNRKEFGQNIMLLYKEKMISEQIYNQLNSIREIMNIAKHDTSYKYNITFDYEDAVIFYFVVRKVGIELLKILESPLYKMVYEINEEL